MQEMSIKIDGIYRHYKTGKLYVVTGFSIDSETMETRVEYKRIGSDMSIIWSRPIKMFFEWIPDKETFRFVFFKMIKDHKPTTECIGGF